MAPPTTRLDKFGQDAIEGSNEKEMQVAPFSLRTIDHVVIRATDAPRLVAFYIEALGCPLTWDRPNLGLTHLKAGDALLDIVSIDGPLGHNGVTTATELGHNVDHFCLRIEPFDFEVLRLHFEKFGIHLDPPRERYGSIGFGLSIYLTDPEGNGIELKASK